MPDFQFPVGARNSSLLNSGQTGSGAHPASYTMGTVGPFPRGKVGGGRGVKQPGHEVDHSPPSSTEIKNGEAIPTLPHMP
jgi:hypothetical protein